MFSKKQLKRKRKLSMATILIECILLTTPIIYKLFINNYIKNNLKIEYKIDYIEKHKNKLKDLYMLFFNKYLLQILIPLLLVYNYCNIYKTFILLISLQIPNIISQILNLLIIKEIDSENEIDDELLFVTGYSLFLWKIIFNSQSKRDKFISNSNSISTESEQFISKSIISFIMIIIIIIAIYIFNFLLFKNIDKIIFDGIIGSILYISFFHIFGFESNNPRQYQKIIEFKLVHYFLIFIFFNLFFVVFCIRIINDNEAKINVIKKIIYKYSATSIVIGIILGAKYEYNYYFEKIFNNWAQYNFEYDCEKSDEEEESLTSSISFNKKIQWNHTSIFLSFLRLLFIFSLTFGCLYSFLFINYNNFIVELLLKYILPLNIFSLGLFSWYKLILKYLKVTNILLLRLLRESF
jgi:hypothetical protein